MGDRATAAPNPVCLTGLAADLWPHTAQLEADGDISVGGLRLSALTGRYGTPAYILDEADVRARCRAYAAAFRGAEIAYAGKQLIDVLGLRDCRFEYGMLIGPRRAARFAKRK